MTSEQSNQLQVIYDNTINRNVEFSIPYYLSFWNNGNINCSGSSLVTTVIPINLTAARKIIFNVRGTTSGLYPFYAGISETPPISKDVLINRVDLKVSNTTITSEIDVSNITGNYYISFYYEISAGYTASVTGCQVV